MSYNNHYIAELKKRMTGRIQWLLVYSDIVICNIIIIVFNNKFIIIIIMKANDLQLGDHIAYISGEHCSVRELNRKGLIAVSFIDAKGKMQYSTLLPERDFEPIPLTAEILEKNFTQHSRYKYDYCTDYFDLYITEYTDGLWCVTVDEIEMSGLPTWKMYVSDVHELQHALRLCGIEKKNNDLSMEFSTDINDKKIDLFFYEDGHKVSDFRLDIDEARSLAIKLQQAIVYLNYEIAKDVKPYGKAPLIKSIEYTDKGVVVHCKQRD